MGVLSGSGCSQSFLGITSGRMMTSSISSSSESFASVLSVPRTSSVVVTSVISVTSVLTSILTSMEHDVRVASVAASVDKADNGISTASDIFTK